ncbi:hypothetical protein Pgy4_38743, partial [Pseudomonas savastanoi pv. glycinea str. race 4]
PFLEQALWFPHYLGMGGILACISKVGFRSSSASTRTGPRLVCQTGG